MCNTALYKATASYIFRIVSCKANPKSKFVKRNHRPQNVATKASFKPQETEFSFFFSSSFLTPQAYTKSFFYFFFYGIGGASISKRKPRPKRNGKIDPPSRRSSRAPAVPNGARVSKLNKRKKRKSNQPSQFSLTKRIIKYR